MVLILSLNALDYFFCLTFVKQRIFANLNHLILRRDSQRGASNAQNNSHFSCDRGQSKVVGQQHLVEKAKSFPEW